MAVRLKLDRNQEPLGKGGPSTPTVSPESPRSALSFATLGSQRGPGLKQKKTRSEKMLIGLSTT